MTTGFIFFFFFKYTDMSRLSAKKWYLVQDTLSSIEHFSKTDGGEVITREW